MCDSGVWSTARRAASEDEDEIVAEAVSVSRSVSCAHCSVSSF